MHSAPWPEPLGTGAGDGASGDPAVLTAASAALIGIRRAKTEAKASQKTPVARLVLRGDDATIAALRLAEGDLKAVGRIAQRGLVGGGKRGGAPGDVAGLMMRGQDAAGGGGVGVDVDVHHQ